MDNMTVWIDKFLNQFPFGLQCRRYVGENIDLGNLLNSSLMFAMDLSRIGDNKTASLMLSSIFGSIRPHLDNEAIASVQQYIN